MKAPDKIFLPEDIDYPSAAILALGISQVTLNTSARTLC